MDVLPKNPSEHRRCSRLKTIGLLTEGILGWVPKEPRQNRQSSPQQPHRGCKVGTFGPYEPPKVVQGCERSSLTRPVAKLPSNLVVEPSSVDIAQQTDRRSSACTTSKDDLGFTAPLVSVRSTQLAPGGCGVPVKPSLCGSDQVA